MSEPESKGADDAQEEGESPSFRVIDRRRFTSDGRERVEHESAAGGTPPGAAAASAPPPAPEPVAPPVRGSAEPPHSTPAAAAGEGFVLASEPNAPGQEDLHALAEPTLSTLLLSLSTQALMHLGEIPDLSTGQPIRDLPAARSIIDLLGVLERKTQGNLDAAEAALLERILYDLRMRFVEISRS